MDVLVGRIGRPHGVRGDVTVEVRTDDPETRFAPGSVLRTDPGAAGPLTVSRYRHSAGNLILGFDGVDDRTGAEGLRGVRLVLSTELLPEIDDPEEYYDHELIGLRARDVHGVDLGEITDVLHPPAAPVLQLLTPGGDEVLVPFVTAVVPEVDITAGFCVIDPPDGLFPDPEHDQDSAAEQA